MHTEQISHSYHMGLEAVKNLFMEEHLKSTVYIQQLEAEGKVCSHCLSFEEGQFSPHVTKSV
ncbi:hypothetical protein [Bacillus cereus group sp. IBL03679]|uniref:hypothetical protein n=1 Tax=Bacillus cereus group sp. IBL03679 TaxID=3240095 RepID=UPI003D2F73A4